MRSVGLEGKLKEEAFAEEERRVEGGRERDGEIKRERERCREKKQNKYCLSMCCAVYMLDI